MYINRLKLNSFRNYELLNIEFQRNFNIIYGNNAQGKTNILESIFICASGRSHRKSKDAELVRLGQEEYNIKIEYEKENREQSIEINYKKNEGKSVKINDVKESKIGKIIGNLNVVIFSPEDITVMKEGPGERRRFIDITISQIKPSYFYDLQQYKKVLIQRNNLLKEIQINRKLIDTLEVWDQSMVNIGSRIIKVRKDYIERLNRNAAIRHSVLTNQGEKLEIKYKKSVKDENAEDINEIKKYFIRAIEHYRNIEIAKGITLVGPQRDDFDMYVNGLNVGLYGSQGQKRTTVLSMKLSEIDIMYEETGELPILLLDDVMSELDQERQDHLLKCLENIQTFITCTEKDFFENKLGNNSKYYKIENGNIGNKM